MELNKKIENIHKFRKYSNIHKSFRKYSNSDINV